MTIMPAFKKVKTGAEVTKCTQEVIDSICNTLRVGAFIETAVVMAGVSKVNFYEWIKMADPSHRRHKKVYATLRNAVSKAIEEATVRDLLNIDKCAMGAEVEYLRDKNGGLVFSENGKPIVLKPGSARDWSASAWRLERRSKLWNKTEKVHQTDKDNDAQVVIGIPDNGRSRKEENDQE